MIEEGRGQLRLDNLPESLQLHILSLLDTKEAVLISLLSKQCLSLWTSKPVLHLNCSDFRRVDDFDKFVNHVLRHRDHSAELNTLTFTRRRGGSRSSGPKILKQVVDYAFSHGVNHLELSIQRFDDNHDSWDGWPPVLSSNSLKTLKLKSQIHYRWPVLSGSFKNLTELYLEGAGIKNNTRGPFLLGFPMLEKLVLKDCYFGKILCVEAMKLTDLTICHDRFYQCELTTPNLRFFKYTGSDFLELETDDGLPVLDTVVIDSFGAYHLFGKKRMNDLISLFQELGNAKSVTLSTSIVRFLGSFGEKLKGLDSPFCDLKCLNMVVGHGLGGGSIEMHSDVKAYLLKRSPMAKFNIIHSSNRGRKYI